MSKINIKVKITFSRRGRISCGIFLAFQIQRDSLKKTHAAAFSRIGSEVLKFPPRRKQTRWIEIYQSHPTDVTF